MTETWKSIPGWPAYEVSDHGRVRSSDRQVWVSRGKGFWSNRKGVLLSANEQESGHLSVTLQDCGTVLHIGVHSLVLRAFDRDPAQGEETCHGDGRPANNRLENLRWGTRLDNHGDMDAHGTRSRGSRIGTSVLKESEVLMIRREVAIGKRHRDVARAFGVSRQTVTSVVSGGAWAHVR